MSILNNSCVCLSACLNVFLSACLSVIAKEYSREGKLPGERREPSLTMINSTLLLQGGKVVSGEVTGLCCAFTPYLQSVFMRVVH